MIFTIQVHLFFSFYFSQKRNSEKLQFQYMHYEFHEYMNTEKKKLQKIVTTQEFYRKFIYEKYQNKKNTIKWSAPNC